MKNVNTSRIAARLLSREMSTEELEVVHGGQPPEGTYWTVTNGRRHRDSGDE